MVDEQLSIGDYVLTGGELAAQVITDSVVRLLQGVLREGSVSEESHENGLLEYPQYTQPRDFNGMTVPEVLLSGNKAKIEDWRLTQSLLLTKKHRPDMFEEYELDDREKKLLKKAQEEET
jgi:tRNA (guanine37-N1)-methyltransferase